ncbi:MAG: ATP-binding cassette domain-containing protein, partial [Chloroflexota bacterium]
ISARHLVKTFDVGNEALTILKSVNLSIPSGQFVGIMGPSGSGKSTLLYLLGGLATLIGIGAGLYPAMRAAHMTTVLALKAD